MQELDTIANFLLLVAYLETVINISFVQTTMYKNEIEGH